MFETHRIRNVVHGSQRKSVVLGHQVRATDKCVRSKHSQAVQGLSNDELFIGINHGLIVVVEPAAIEEMGDAINAQITVGHFLPEPPAEFGVGKNKLSLGQFPDH